MADDTGYGVVAAADYGSGYDVAVCTCGFGDGGC